VAIGIVMQLRAGEAILKLPWLDEDYRTDWVRIATPMTGDGYGQFFMPKEGDEVLVAFDRGNLDFPYVIGYLWNGKHRPPETDVSLRIIRTYGTHTLRFEDGDDQGHNKKVVLKSSGGNTITLDDSGAEAVTIETPGGQKITLEDGGSSITITAGDSSVTMNPASITLTGGGRSLTLSGGQILIT
jgi:uncharacterized protein involved in type VI secretion and phage assembly